MDQSVIVNLLKTKVVGKILVGAFFRPNQKLWSTFPSTVTKFPAMRAYGSWLHTLARMRPIRMSYFYTSFFRNRPLLELARRLADQKSRNSGLKIAVLGCSIGAEVYSLVWTIREKRQDLNIVVNAVDLSQEALDFAQNGTYPPDPAQFTEAQILASLTDQEMREMFDRDGDRMTIKPWIKEGITWRVGDAADSQLADMLGPQDMVFANNLLCHMYPAEAERCLRNVVSLVTPGGYVFVSGIDLDVRTRVVRDLRLEPVIDLIEEIHNGDHTLITDWPFKYWGLEPFSMARPDWRMRYSSVFRVSRYHAGSAQSPEKPA
jgi:SAM-dependent methyltransferase